MKRKQLLLLLALLMTAATGAWAQQVLKVKPITQEMATPWAEDNGSTLLTPDHLPGFCPATEEEAKWWADVPQEGTAILIYHIDDPDDPEASTNVSYVQFEDGQYSQSVSQTECAINSLAEAILNQGVKIFYTWAPTYTVKLADGTKDAANWTIVPAKASDPEFGVAKGKPVTLNYKGRLKVKAVTATHDGWNGDLSNIPASALEADGQTLIVPDGTTLKGTLDVSTTPYKIVIPDDATVTLAGVTIDGENDNHYRWAGINLEGDAIIILADYTENTVEAFYQASPGIHVPSGKTLTIQGGEKGTGKLTARSNGWAAGIGGGYTLSCGHIRIEGGDITATGGTQAAGIGGGNGAVCGDITITGGTVTATGGKYCSGIGSGNFGPCGDITITDGVTLVTATKGEDAPNSIGAGNYSTCGTVTIGDKVYWENNAAVDDDAAAYLGQATIEYTVVDLSTLKDNYTANHGNVLTGTRVGNYNVEIADGATVTLAGVDINGDSYCIRCLGDATIVLKDGTTNTLTSTSEDYPALWAGDENTTLTIKGSTGELNVMSGECCAGIGGGWKNTNHTCGNITIEGGVITAQSAKYAPGIGSDKGGSVKCGNITITNGVTRVTATKGGEEAPYSIGASDTGSCGTVTIGGTVYWQDNAPVDIDADNYLRQPTIIYPEP